ncbi:MAG: hypothetical protein SNF33_06295 [Candidatus Algichlamydia australiensis]|nr:hypothetical protein [Chlamydiales bacterium]
MKCTIFSLILLVSCAGGSNKNYHERGQSLCDQLAKELSTITTKEELVSRAPQIEKRYAQIVDLMIEAKIEKERRPHAFEKQSEPSLSSERLKKELERIYEIEGGRRFIEKHTRESLYRLGDTEQPKLSEKHSKIGPN